MPANKKHHYVPKFYLRRFSATDGTSINLFNIAKHRAIKNGNLSNQCYSNRFYGPDLGVEKALGELEREASKVFAQIDITSALPRARSDGHCSLVSFVVLQAARTKAAGIAADEAFEKIYKAAFRDDPRLKDVPLDKIHLEHEHPALLPLSTAAKVIPAVMDMSIRLLVNRTRLEFVTSDNPVVLHNQYCEGARDIGTTGWAQSGLQTFCPISANLALFLFDARVYKVPDGEYNGVIEIQEEKVISHLNALQWLNALDNIYYRSESQEDEIARAAKRWATKRNRPESHGPRIRSRIKRSAWSAGIAQTSASNFS